MLTALCASKLVRDIIRKERSPLEDLIVIVKKRRLKWHLIGANNLSTAVLLGTTLGKRRQGKQYGKSGLTTSLVELEDHSQRP